jgi:hypothetical protein
MVRDEGGRGSRMGYRRTVMASGRRMNAAPRRWGVMTRRAAGWWRAERRKYTPCLIHRRPSG